MNKCNTTTYSLRIKKILTKPIFLIFSCILFCSHDLFLKMESYFLEINQLATLSLYNGTFDRSENIITRDRMIDASIYCHGERQAISSERWTDIDSTITQLNFTPNKEATYVAGVSTKARNIELTAEKFNNYLEHDGILDMLQARKDRGLLDQDAVESYQKHVKAIYQVGDHKTDDWKIVLGYPIEFIPQDNPYEKNTGDELDFQLLLDGKPLANQLVYADYIISGHNHSHGDHSHNHDMEHDEDHSHTGGQELKTNENGLVTVTLPNDGIYYIRTIHMVELNDDEELTHQSKWATLTFEVTHNHNSFLSMVPKWIFVLISIGVISLLAITLKKCNSKT